MSNRLFQSVIHQMKDAIDRVIGVIDENGYVIACSELVKIGETRQGIKEELSYSSEVVVSGGYTYRPLSGGSKAEYVVFIEGEDKMAEKMTQVLAISLSNIKNLYDEKYDKGSFIKNIILDNILPSDIYIKSKELHFNTEETRIVFLIKFFGKTEMMPYEMLQNMFPDKSKDYVISVGEHDIVLVKELKNTLSIPVDIHSHYTAGLASMSILKGIEAGADIVDTAMSPLALGTSHMPTESLVAALQGTDYDTGLDLNQLNVVRAYFAKLREKYIANGQINPKSLGVDANTLLYQVPGGMFSNMLKQLKDAGKEDKLQDVLEEIPRVREDAGYPPLVTPTSQIVGSQAVLNVLAGKRYARISKESKGLLRGEYGALPGEVNEEVRRLAIGDEEVITCRPADLIEPELEKYREEYKDIARCEEDVLSLALFPQVASKFLKNKYAPAPTAAESAENSPRVFYVDDAARTN